MKGFNPNEILMLARVVGGGALYMAISIARKVRARSRASEPPDSEALDELWGALRAG